MRRLSVAAAILHWKNDSHLEKLLPSAKTALEQLGHGSLVVVDNGASDGSRTKEWLTSSFPSVEYFPAPRNEFLYSYNLLSQVRSEDILLFLNNDVRLAANFFEPLLRHFSSPDVFAVSATSRDWQDSRYISGPVRLRSHHGIYYWDFDRDRQVLSHTLFCSGACVAVDRGKFLELGGFNKLFAPAYGEDLDLCFRAWKRGWRCVFEPRSIVYHREGGSFAAQAPDRSKRLMLRARLLFQWSSLPSANAFERPAYQLLTAMRQTSAGATWWIQTWLRTWLEWLRIRKQFGWMKTTAAELHELERRIAAPVPLEVHH